MGTPQERYQAFEDAENFAIQSTEKLLSGMESVEEEESQMTREESAENAANYLENIGQANQPEQGQSMIPQAPVTIPPNIVEPTAKRLPSPAPGPIFPINKGSIAIIVESDVIIIARNLLLQASKAAL